MIEGPGHVPFDTVRMNIELEKAVCHGARSTRWDR